MIILKLLFSPLTYIHMCLALFLWLPDICLSGKFIFSFYYWYSGISKCLLLQTVLLWPSYTDLSRPWCESFHWTNSYPWTHWTNSYPWTHQSHTSSIVWCVCKGLIQFVCSSVGAWEWKMLGSICIAKGALKCPHEYTAFFLIKLLWVGPCLWIGNWYSTWWMWNKYE